MPLQGPIGLGVAFFVSVFLHGIALQALSADVSTKPTEILGNLLGSAHKGMVVYAVQSASVGESTNSEKSAAIASAPVKLVRQKIASSALVARPQDAPAVEVQGGLSKPAESIQGLNFGSRNGFMQPIFSVDQTSGRESGFLGPATPAGAPEGAVPLSAQWAMRRQAALSSVGAQLHFMFQTFALDEGTTCLVGPASATCNPSNEGLLVFLSSRYAEMHLLDPSLPPMLWRSHGYGQWSFDLHQ